MSNQGDQRSVNESDSPPWVTYARNVLLVVVLGIMLWLVFTVRLPSMEELQAWIDSLGWAGWLAFIGLYAIVAVTPIPVTIMAVTGGLLFGAAVGSVLSVVGVLIGCMGGYALTRLVGRPAATKLLGSWGPRIERGLSTQGFLALLTLRLTPGIPYWPVNYGAGAFGVRPRIFFVSTLAACIPGQVSLVALGSFVGDPSIATAAVVVIAWIVVLTLTVLSLRSWRRQAREDDDAPSESDRLPAEE